MYRVNFGNGQVWGPFQNRAAAERYLAEQNDPRAFVERFEAGSADDPGDWFRVRSLKKR